MSGIYINTRFDISSASSDGNNLTYLCNNNFSEGQRVVVDGSSNPDFDTEDSVILSATDTQFVIEDKSVSSSATSSGGVSYLVAGEWKSPGTVYARVGGAWRIVGQTFVKTDGLWRRTTFGAPPVRPVMDWYSTGRFEITNYDPSLVYETQFVSGSGSASLNTSTGVYTLSGANSAFNVIARYGPGAPASEAGYMERKARTQRYIKVGENCYGINCVENRVPICNEGASPIIQAPIVDLNGNVIVPGGNIIGYFCSGSCGCLDTSQNRCICWRYGQPNPLCYGTRCDDIMDWRDDPKWGGSPYFYTDRGTEWSKQS